ncbi:sensor histidine kinase [Aquimarina sp. U1-2]|uniref:sensor histidine kinase n=1 Tax=Aquimarina sp. U1-2 TaxID=2823141 RepID=UPI001AECA1F9|nr:sensor histidine kinase [Aquimarina sp. U1-2]MBP2830666.1 sensor histidine kinase [Aquimarina sp. U1-2]
MKKTKRALIQIILWLSIWIVIILIQGGTYFFIIDNIAAFGIQVLLIIASIWYLVPKLLLQKKYVLFAIVSLGILLISTYMSTHLVTSAPLPPRRITPQLMDNPIPSQLFIHLLMISIAFVIATLLEIFGYAQKKEEEMIRSKNENLQTELKLLKSQINPHFLFNALNNIYALSVINSNKTQKSIIQLSDMLRYVLYECQKQWVPLEDEILYINNYIQLFSLKSSKNYPITTDFNIVKQEIRVAPMLFIPFVENALKHSNIETISDAFIQISLYADMKQIEFNIVNSIPENTFNKDKVGGIGVENVIKRLSILYPNLHKLTINKTDQTYTAQLNLRTDEHD